MAAVFKSDKQVINGAVLDRAAICVSAVCLVQCLLLPVLLVISPLVSLGILGDAHFHLALLAVILPLSLAAFALGYRRHRNRQMLIPGLSGLAVIILAAGLEGGVLGPLGSALLTSLGGVLLILGHWINLRQRRQLCLRPQ
jgi:hypothetical protein